MEKIKSLLKNKAFIIALVCLISVSILAAGTYAWFTTAGTAEAANATITAAELGITLEFENDDVNALKLLPGEDETTAITATFRNTGNREVIARVNLSNADGGVTVKLADDSTALLGDLFPANEDYFDDDNFATDVGRFGTYGDNLILPRSGSAEGEFLILDGYLYVYLEADQNITIGENGELTYGIAGKSYNQNILQGSTIDLTNDDGEVEVKAVQATIAAVTDVFGATAAEWFLGIQNP